jgi:hypothetical protein
MISTTQVFPYGRWNGDKHDHVAVSGKLATLAWIEASSFEKMPHSRPTEVNESFLIDDGDVACTRFG